MTDSRTLIDASPVKIVGITITIGNRPIILTKEEADKLLYSLMDMLGYKFITHDMETVGGEQ